MATYPLELAQDAAYQSYTSRLTELWSLPKPAQGLNTYNEWMNNYITMHGAKNIKFFTAQQAKQIYQKTLI
jgi:hypothetical protein